MQKPMPVNSNIQYTCIHLHLTYPLTNKNIIFKVTTKGIDFLGRGKTIMIIS